ncbi:MAG: anhydro-N-acetylmuramic acid kinase [Bacteroidales bacterium]|nr:anhydro-N-acetylmuramic acid kinase [Bacteroidales bacterium]
MKIVGLMSGTSLDGVDLACCTFERNADGTIAWQVELSQTVPYPDSWTEKLTTLTEASALEYAKADIELGHLFGLIVNNFIKDNKLVVDAIASHGHTIFHQPNIGLTTQIGDIDAIAAETGLPVVGRFRTLDVALGGQGAPLVPIGDELLFGQYDACLNLGGIANISYRADGQRVAYDICPCNMALNRLASQLGLPYDNDGCNARNGHSHSCLLSHLDNLPYYAETGPKSLGKEWFVSQFWPVVEAADLSSADSLATVASHIALQIARVLEHQHIKSLLVTGGGAFNSYLIELIGEYCPTTAITVPDPLIVNYKEAIIFALLGFLRLTGQVNTLASVTGARCDSIGGSISGLFKC